MQTSFSELEYAAKKKQARRDRFLSEIEAVTPWVELEKAIAPYYPSSGGRGRSIGFGSDAAHVCRAAMLWVV
ncbi:protein of unknown function [Candidatus Nitrotoga arctica]|uniref:Transposase, IS5 family n=1 Tax=Candidatus Nitrotoga arctica TaxID=453162 RepID=A0ABN8AGN9_9PROT|nr:protein of unknown function [Candidatus Nitrotoga arctica]